MVDIEKSIAFYGRYVQMKVVKRRENRTNVWLGDGIPPSQLVLLEAEQSDMVDARSGATDYPPAKLAHPIVASSHIGFTCRTARKNKLRFPTLGPVLTFYVNLNSPLPTIADPGIDPELDPELGHGPGGHASQFDDSEICFEGLTRCIRDVDAGRF